MNPSRAKFARLLISAVRYGLLIVTIMVIFVPFAPDMPGVGLDPSWKLGMNQAVAQSLQFGRDMIFTFGPYSFIFTEAYHPATDTLMLLSCLFLCVVYCVCLVTLLKNRHWLWMFAYCTLLASMLYPRDALLFSLPLVIALTTYKVYFSETRSPMLGMQQHVQIALLFAPLGLLPLAKGSLLILCATVTLLCAVFFIVEKRPLHAAISLTAPFVSAMFFWTVIGQSPFALQDYVMNMLPIISGYTEAMALDGIFLEIEIYLLTAVLLLAFILTRTQISRQQKTFLLILYSAFLFLAYKAGFTRHDIHALTAGNAIGIAALLLPFVTHDRFVVFLVLLAGITFFGITKSNVEFPERALVTQFETTFLSAWDGICNRVARGGPERDYQANIIKLKKAADFPFLAGTTDIYSHDQSYLIASGYVWSPRPVLQSYSAYTPQLTEINRQHLIGTNAPQNIIFNLQSIDDRLPSLMDGPSWPVLMKNYHTTGMHSGYLFLEKNAGVNTSDERLLLSSSTQQLGSKVLIPDLHQPIFAQLQIRPTLLGRLANFLYKPDVMYITLESYHGQTQRYRFVASMGKSTFLISPLIENTYEFKLLNEQSNQLEVKRVKSITISAAEDGPNLWNSDYTISFSGIKNGKP